MSKMMRPEMIIFIIFVFLDITKAVSAQSRERRNALQPPEITVTLKMEWNVSVVGKSIPSSYVTKVKNGTVLVDILNKAADEDKQGPFNKYDSTYHAGLGHAITSMNGIRQDHASGTYWQIFDQQTGGGLPCGITSYVPHDNSTTVFRLSASFSHNGSVGGYCKPAFSGSQGPSSLITVTIGLDWNVQSVGKPIPAPYTAQVASDTNLEDILNKAADEKGPFNKYETTYHGGLGYSITAMNGIEQDPQTNTYWIIYDNKTGEPTPHGIRHYKPRDNSVTVFRLVEGLSYGSSTGSPTEIQSDSARPKAVDMLLIWGCLLAVVQSRL